MSQPVYPENKMKRKLRNGEVVIGMMSSSGSPIMTEMMGYAGLDYVVIETEHAPICMEDTGIHLVRAAELADLTPLMRVRDNDPSLIHKALDMGCQGVFVVHVNSKDDAQRIVDAVKYPPMGHRASGGLRHLGRYRYAAVGKDYLDYWNRESLVMFIVESKEGVDNLEEIVTVPNIDVIGIGQGDLSYDLGAPAPRFGNPDCVKAVEKLLALCKLRGIAVRDIFSDVETARKWYKKGVRVFEWGSDIGVFQDAVKDIMAKTKVLRTMEKKK